MTGGRVAVVLASPLWLRAHSLGSGVSQGHLSPSGDPDPAPRRPWTDHRAPAENPCLTGLGAPSRFTDLAMGLSFSYPLMGIFSTTTSCGREPAPVPTVSQSSLHDISRRTETRVALDLKKRQGAVECGARSDWATISDRQSEPAS